MHNEYLVTNAGESTSTVQKFEKLVPISGRETPSGPGVWVWSDAVDLQGDAEMLRDWMTDKEKDDRLEKMKMKLLKCFNRMFTPSTEVDKDKWEQQQWHNPRVTNKKHGDDCMCTHYSTIFDVESDRGADGPCVLKFSFQCNNTHVLVNYKGPVRFDLNLVQETRDRKGVGWLVRGRAEWQLATMAQIKISLQDLHLGFLCLWHGVFADLALRAYIRITVHGPCRPRGPRDDRTPVLPTALLLRPRAQSHRAALLRRLRVVRRAAGGRRRRRARGPRRQHFPRRKHCRQRGSNIVRQRAVERAHARGVLELHAVLCG